MEPVVAGPDKALRHESRPFRAHPESACLSSTEIGLRVLTQASPSERRVISGAFWEYEPRSAR